MKIFKTLKVSFSYEGVEYLHLVTKDNMSGPECSWWDSWFDKNGYTFQVAGDMFNDTLPTDNNLRVFVYKKGDYEDEDRIAEITNVDVINCVLLN